ncbi:hypothetical protein C6P42_003895, partial [Pichia californica]
MSRNDSGNNNYNTDFNSPNSNYLNTNSSSNTPFTSDSANTNFNINSNSSNNLLNSGYIDASNIPYSNSNTNFGFIDNYVNDFRDNTNNTNNIINTNNTNNDDILDIEDFDKQFIDSILNQRDSNLNSRNMNNNLNSSLNSNLNGSPIAINLNSVPINNNNNNSSNNNNNNNFSMNTVNNSSTNTDTLSSSIYQSPQPISLIRDTSSLRTEAFSPQSLGFSTNFTSHKLGKSLSNSLAKSYGSQLGTSLNSLISPSSNYDDFLDSPYGSYNDESLKSPINSPSLKSFVGSPSSVNTHLNPKSALSKETKLSRRRELHNAVERRRRDLIKEKIKELGSLIPPTMLYDNSKSKSINKDTKANKNIILNKCVSYIIYLKEILESQDKRLAKLEDQIEQMNLNSNDINNDINNDVDINNNNSNTRLDLESFQKNLSAFTDDVNIKPSESKLNFMDFSNNHSEPVDFRKLSETYKSHSEMEGGALNSINNQNPSDDLDLLLNLDHINSNDEENNINKEIDD